MKKPFYILLVLFSFSIVYSGCSEFVNEPAAEEENQQSNVLTKDNPQVREAIKVQEKVTGDYITRKGVTGTAVGLTEEGKPCLLLLVESEEAIKEISKAAPIPDRIENLPVEVMVTGKITAFRSTKVNHKIKQTAPIQLGTSGGWGKDLANGYCCGGTLGSLVSIGGKQYVLSNYHVLESDIVAGGNGTAATTGDNVIQPGLIDVSCNVNNAQAVAKLEVKQSLPGSNVDAAVAEVIPGMVSNTGAILEVGTISKTTRAAALRLKVKKSGRTTGLTRSTITGLNATVNVAYDNECAGGAAFTKTFTGQIVVRNYFSSFLAGGDSGSLMVEDVSTNPKAVGLLFAGSSMTAIANPINEVLQFLGGSMVGN